MGGCLSVSISSDQAVKQFSDCLCGEASNVYKLEENLDDLSDAIERLKIKRDDLQRKVNDEEGRGFRQVSWVKEWFSRVASVEVAVDKLLRDREVETQRLCLCGYCSKNCISTYRYGKRVSKKRRDVEALVAKGDFTVVTEREPALERPIQPTVGQDTLLKKAWKLLMNDEVRILGIHGMGGVGKTTLLNQINNKLRTNNEFDVVIWVVVSSQLQIERIQEDIWKRLGFYNEQWTQKRQDEKAVDIYNDLRRKKFVLLLDDVWEKVDLERIGVPYPDKKNGCKVAFTTRSQEVCGYMGADDEMEVECLAQNDAWNLFKRKVGENTLNSHPDISEHACTIVRKCHGLPLALNVIGETMARKKTVQEWHNAVDVLTSDAAEFKGMDKILPILKFSYDNLEGGRIKSCFLYCSFFPEDDMISKEKLIRYWLGEEFIDGKRDWGRVENEGYEIIGTLVRAGLLIEPTEDKSRDTVKMHDVVREMALWVVSDYGKKKEKFVVRTRANLQQILEVKDWDTIERMSLMYNGIKNISGNPYCPSLLTLNISHNDLKNISGKFCLSMPNLTVLDLSENRSLTELPEQISKLVALRYLDLSWTAIQRLPIGFMELRELMILDLSQTYLKSITGIQGLKSLYMLRLWGCRSLDLDSNSMKELLSLKHLNVLDVPLRKIDGLREFLSSNKLLRATRCAAFYDPALPMLDIITALANSSVRGLSVEGILETEMDLPRNLCFRNLNKVDIYCCRNLRDLTWLLFVPNLTHLYVGWSAEIEEIISREKMGDAVINGQPFQRLQGLILLNLEKLKSIYWSPLLFPCLVEVEIYHCPKVKKLPLNSESAKGCDISIKANAKWIEEVEWEDEATKDRFWPCVSGLPRELMVF